jgi:hypothetical protein
MHDEMFLERMHFDHSGHGRSGPFRLTSLTDFMTV